jgi:hypothetical protein
VTRFSRMNAGITWLWHFVTSTLTPSSSSLKTNPKKSSKTLVSSLVIWSNDSQPLGACVEVCTRLDWLMFTNEILTLYSLLLSQSFYQYHWRKLIIYFRMESKNKYAESEESSANPPLPDCVVYPSRTPQHTATVFFLHVGSFLISNTDPRPNEYRVLVTLHEISVPCWRIWPNILTSLMLGLFFQRRRSIPSH